MDVSVPRRMRWRVPVTVVAVVLSLAYVAAYGLSGSYGAYLVPPTFVLLGWPLVVLGNRPVLALALVVAPTVALTPLLNVEIIGPVGVVAVGAAVGKLAANRRWPVSLPSATVALLAQAGTAVAYWRGSTVPTLSILALVMVCAWTVGNSVGQRRRHVAARRVDETERAVTAERLRIARDVHDLIAHSMGAIAFQAGVGRRVIDNRPDEARNALDAIETTSRETLAELRRTLTALRRSDPEAAPDAPAPGLADVDRLIATTADAGVQVDVSRTGTVRDLPGDLDLAAYRIVQEAVTNVVRHAGTDRCLVRLDYGHDSLSIEVLDDGPGVSGTGTGYGLVGMRERVTLLDGRFAAGPRAEGGFRVAATIPTHG